MRNDIDLIEDSFTKLKTDKAIFSEYFYTRLFEKAPQLKPLFVHTNVKTQGMKLYAALVLLVENIRHPEELERVLIPLGERHKGYGAIDRHYPIVGETLLETLEHFLEADWTPEVRKAWTDTINKVTRIMLTGAGAKLPQTSGEAVLMKKAEKIDRDKDRQFDLVEQSFKKITPVKEAFAESFYTNLFEKFPEVKPLFARTDLKKQAGKLYGALLMIVENLRNTKTLEKVLAPLGERHKGYGIIDAHYALMEGVLLETLEEFLQPDWNPELKAAWSTAYGIAAKLMQEGANTENKKTDKKEGQKEKASTFSKAERIDDKSKFSSTQRAQKGSKNRLLHKVNNLFWNSPKWKIALGVSIAFFLIVPLETDIPILKDFLDVVEPLSIVLALILYIKESPERKKQFHYQAWSIVDAANGIRNSYARIIALQDLCDDGVSLKGLELSNAELSGIELNGCDLSNANFSQSSLNNAEMYASDLNNADLSNAKCTSINLTKANLGFANLQKTNFSSANFSGANLMFANMSEGNFSGADFSNAKLKGANFEGAYFSGANLQGAEVNLEDIKKAYLVKAIMPDGSIHP